MGVSGTAKPLAGVRVIEFGTLIAGPFCTRILAEFGAEVIKVEAPGEGDPLRKWRKLYGDTSLWWYIQARNKKSVTINLKHPDGKDIVRRLVKGADIVVENFRPGVLEKLGLGWNDLSAINPGLVMVRLSGFGQTGPMAAQPGFGAIGESMGGLRYVTGFPDRPPVKTGISIGKHPMAFFREDLNRRGILSARETLNLKKGQVVSSAGAVIIRQRPMTANNVVFITLEDETGFANFVVMPDKFEEYRAVINQSNFLIIRGIFEERGMLKAMQFWPLTEAKTEVVSHNFR